MKKEIQVGVGLRPTHYPIIEQGLIGSCDWFEALTENYLDTHGRPLQILEKTRSLTPIGLHGVSLSIASLEKPDPEYLRKLHELVQRIDPWIVSDHLSWSKSGKHNSHDLMPFQFTQKRLETIVENIQIVQDVLKRPISLENISYYIDRKDHEMSETEFFRQLVSRTGCGILLDLNNVYVNAFNFNFDPKDYLLSMPLEAVTQVHLAGHTDTGKFLFDTHSKAVSQPVLDLLKFCAPRLESPRYLIEWDQDVPSYDVMLTQVAIVRQALNEVLL